MGSRSLLKPTGLTDGDYRALAYQAPRGCVGRVCEAGHPDFQHIGVGDLGGRKAWAERGNRAPWIISSDPV